MHRTFDLEGFREKAGVLPKSGGDCSTPKSEGFQMVHVDKEGLSGGRVVEFGNALRYREIFWDTCRGPRTRRRQQRADDWLFRCCSRPDPAPRDQG